MRIDYAHKHWLREVQLATVASAHWNAGFATGVAATLLGISLAVLFFVEAAR
jgi:hypothetical protein